MIAWTSCKKEKGTLSRTYTVSYPLVSFKAGFSQYYSVPVGSASLPDNNTILASVVASDTFYTTDKIAVSILPNDLNSINPGLYVITIAATNEHGFTGYNYVYVAVTNITDSINLGGQYVRLSNGDTVNVTKLARGLYRTDNVGGVLSTSPQFIVPAYFVQLTSLTMDLPSQPTALGTLEGDNSAVSMVPGDTTYQYQIGGNSNFSSTSVRVFKKL